MIKIKKLHTLLLGNCNLFNTLSILFFIVIIDLLDYVCLFKIFIQICNIISYV
jgi:hypothetical protein